MKIDLDKISGTRKVELIEIGRMFGSDVVKAQGEQLVGAFAQYKGVIVRYGFTEEDAEEVAELVTMYPPSLGARENKQVGRSVSSAQLKAQMRAGKQGRSRGHALLVPVLNRLAAQSDNAADDIAQAAQTVRVILARTQPAPKTVDALLSHLRLILQAWDSKVVAVQAAQRGGDEVKALIQAQIAVLESTQKDLQQATTTSADTQRLDLIDGLIIERVREASRAAKVAAKVEGNPALADAFKLKHLYG